MDDYIHTKRNDAERKFEDAFGQQEFISCSKFRAVWEEVAHRKITEAEFAPLEYHLASETGDVQKSVWKEFCRWFSPLTKSLDSYQTSPGAPKSFGWDFETIVEVAGSTWFFGFCDATEAKDVLSNAKHGNFLFRFSRDPGWYSLSVNYGPVGHWRIRCELQSQGQFCEPRFFIDDKTYRSLKNIVQTHSEGGIPLKTSTNTELFLTEGMNRTLVTKKPIELSAEVKELRLQFQGVGIEEPRATQYAIKFGSQGIDIKSFARLDERMFKELGVLQMGDIIKLMKLKLDISLKQFCINDVKILESIGKGSFGEVYRAIWQGNTEIALKSLHSSQLNELEAESTLLMQLRHPFIISYMGIYHQTNPDTYSMATEYMNEGSLDQLLIKKRNELTFADLLQMAKDALAGMKFLHSKKIIHRDLSARNLLVKREGNKYVVKVGDFGLSRSLLENDFYETTNMKFARKWSAPESCTENKFSYASDIWSYAVCVWEILQFGEVPFKQYSNPEAVKKVLEGERLPCPQNCPDSLWNILMKCWSVEPQKRPTWDEIQSTLDNLLRIDEPIAVDMASLDIGTTPNFYEINDGTDAYEINSQGKND